MGFWGPTPRPGPAGAWDHGALVGLEMQRRSQGEAGRRSGEGHRSPVRMSGSDTIPFIAASSRPRRARRERGPMVVVLVGFMGAGKTTVGHIIAERLGLPFVDSDVLIEQRLGRDIRDIFTTEGEGYFRQLEHVTVAGLVRGPEAVIALGGGAVEDPRTRAVLRNARVVYLRVSYDEALSRVKSD